MSWAENTIFPRRTEFSRDRKAFSPSWLENTAFSNNQVSIIHRDFIRKLVSSLTLPDNWASDICKILSFASLHRRIPFCISREFAYHCWFDEFLSPWPFEFVVLIFFALSFHTPFSAAAHSSLSSALPPPSSSYLLFVAVGGCHFLISIRYRFDIVID